MFKDKYVLSVVVIGIVFVVVMANVMIYGANVRERMRQEGRDAAIAGHGAETCPYIIDRSNRYDAAGLWLAGWVDEKRKEK